jgi:MOSC domain-containing protein YiiM
LTWSSASRTVGARASTWRSEKEGDVGAGDAIQLLGRDANEITVADVTRLYLRDVEDLDKMRRALQIEALPEGWRTYFGQQVEQPEK